MGPERLLKTQFYEKKGKLSSEVNIVAFFSPNMECHKPQGTICKGPEGVFTINVQMIRSFVWDLRGR